MITFEMQAWKDTEQMLSCLVDVTMKFPKAYKYTFERKITNVSLI